MGEPLVTFLDIQGRWSQWGRCRVGARSAQSSPNQLAKNVSRKSLFCNVETDSPFFSPSVPPSNAQQTKGTEKPFQ